MKYSLLIVLMATCFFGGCKKTNNISASVLFYNATWSLPSVSAAWNSTDIITAPLSQGQVSGTADSPYIKVPAGTNLITIKTNASVFIDKNIYATAASGTSFIFFDTSTVQSPARMLQLTDDLVVPDTFQLKYRMLNLVPDTSIKIDLWLVNGTTDSALLDSAGTFIGATAAASSVQTFTARSYHGGNYTVKIKKTGTEEIYQSLAAYPFAIKGIYSIIFSGLPNSSGSGFKLSVLRHPAG